LVAALKITLQMPPENAKAVRELLLPWQFDFSDLDNSDLAIVYKYEVPDAKKSVVIPHQVATELPVDWSVIAHRTLSMGNVGLSLAATEDLFSIDRPREKKIQTPLSLTEGDGLLDFDIISAFQNALNQTLNASQSKLYKIFTSLPIPYGASPKMLRDLFMKDRSKITSLSLFDKLRVDNLRTMLTNAIGRVSGKEPLRKKWAGQDFACVITHDIEDSAGLERALQLKKLEEKYDICSVWFIPSNRYKLKGEIVSSLANFGEVGCHDTKHDGKLASLSKPELIERLSQAKETLEVRGGTSIEGFRAPLLQHSPTILGAVSDSGYLYDASIPCWEPKHPYTMKPHGIGTVFPFHVNGLPELPLTLPQDHQMLHALGMTPKQTVETWAKITDEIKTVGGLCVFLTHPNELANAENETTYEDLLTLISSDKDTSILLPKKIAEHMTGGFQSDFIPLKRTE
jgi:hypothetical protein